MQEYTTYEIMKNGEPRDNISLGARWLSRHVRLLAHGESMIFEIISRVF